MTDRHYRWRCTRCDFVYESPIPVMQVSCGHHKGGPVACKPIEEERNDRPNLLD